MLTRIFFSSISRVEKNKEEMTFLKVLTINGLMNNLDFVKLPIS